MNSANRLLLALTSLLLLCLCAAFLSLGALVWATAPQPELAADDALPLRTPFLWHTPFAEATFPGGALGATSTPVQPLISSSPVQRTPSPYDLIVPTPTAPAMVYPVAFDSKLEIATYPVSGRSESDLTKALKANALPDTHEPGSRYYAQTAWYLSAHWDWTPTGRGCEIDRADVSIAMTMTLPVLSGAGDLSSDLRSRWNTFLANTITHEVGHVNLDLQGARELQRDLGNLAAAPNCNVIQARIQDVFDQARDSTDRANVDYDARTNHGVKQGATFPPK